MLLTLVSKIKIQKYKVQLKLRFYSDANVLHDEMYNDNILNSLTKKTPR